MGDTFQIIADVDVRKAEVAVTAATIVDWLSGAGIIESQPTDCVIGAEFGYRPGPQSTLATMGIDGNFLNLRANGFEIVAGPRVFHPIPPNVGCFGPVACHHCAQITILENPDDGSSTDAWEDFSEAIERWHEGGSSEVRCAHCGSAVAFNNWNWPDEWPFTVGFLGFTFWNWPRLSQDFIGEFSSRLGHRIVVTRGKM